MTKWGTAVDVKEGGVMTLNDDGYIDLSFETISKPPINFYLYLHNIGWEIYSFYFAPKTKVIGSFSYYDTHRSFTIPQQKEDIQKHIPKDITHAFGIFNV